MKNCNLKAHLLTHGNGKNDFQCSYCDKAFIAKLKVHLKTHTGNMLYQCSHHSKSFLQISYLKSQMSKHTGEKPYQCTHCD